MLLVCGCLKGVMGVLGVVFYIVVGMMGTSHNPFVWLRYPVTNFLTCLKAWIISLLNRARQLSLQSFPIDNRLPVRIFGGIWHYLPNPRQAISSPTSAEVTSYQLGNSATTAASPYSANTHSKFSNTANKYSQDTATTKTDYGTSTSSQQQ